MFSAQMNWLATRDSRATDHTNGSSPQTRFVTAKRGGKQALCAALLMALLPGLASAMAQPTPSPTATPATATPTTATPATATPATATPATATPPTPTPTPAPCICIPAKLIPGGTIAMLRNVATGGKASKVPKSVTVRLKADDVTPGSCTSGGSSDPVTVSLLLEDDDGDVILNQAKPGFVCTANTWTDAKFTAIFEGPKNCEDSVAPTQQSIGDIDVTMVTDDGTRHAARKIKCAATLPVVFTFTPPAHYHVNQGATLNFTVTAARKSDPKTVTATGMPPGATFDGTNFSWVGAFADQFDSGRHDITFMADGDETAITIGTTERELLSFELTDSAGQIIVAPVSVPVGGQGRVQGRSLFDNPFGDPSPIAGQGTNAWANLTWAIDDVSLADFFSVTNVAVIDGMSNGTTQVHAKFTDASLGEMTASATLDVLDVISVSIDPPNLSFPEGSTEPFTATATLEGGAQTQNIDFAWSSSDIAVATVTGGSQAFSTAHIGNVTGMAQGSATISASAINGSVVTGTASITLVPAFRNQELFGMDKQPSGNQVIAIDNLGGSQFVAAMLPPYNDVFCSASSLTTNELLVGGFEMSTGFSEIQRISPLGVVTAEFTSTSTTPQGDTIDVQAIRYRPDGVAWFGMSDNSDRFDTLDAAGNTTKIGGPMGNDGVGPTSIAPFGNDLVYSGPWGFEFTEMGNVVGFADLIARYDDVTKNHDAIAKVGVTFPRLAAPGGDLRVLDGSTGELFRFVDLDSDGDHYFIQGTTVQTAEDDPGERIPAGQLPEGFNTLRLDLLTGDMISTRIVGIAPQHITVMRLADLNSDGDVDDAGEQTIVFDAGAPAGSDIQDVLLKY